jgi:hypothetical protein
MNSLARDLDARHCSYQSSYIKRLPIGYSEGRGLFHGVHLLNKKKLRGEETFSETINEDLRDTAAVIE